MNENEQIAEDLQHLKETEERLRHAFEELRAITHQLGLYEDCPECKKGGHNG